MENLSRSKKTLWPRQWKLTTSRPLPPKEFHTPPYHILARLCRLPHHTAYERHKWKLWQWWPVNGVRRLRIVGNPLVDLLPGIDPFLEHPPIIRHRAVEANFSVLFPRIHLEHYGGIQLIRMILLAKVKIAGNNLVKSENDKFDIIAIDVIAKGTIVLHVTFPAELCGQVEVKDLEVIRLGVDQQVPRAYVTVNNAQSEVDIVDDLYNS